MNYFTKQYAQPMNICRPCNPPYPYTVNTNKLDTRNVFKHNTDDMPIKYKPYCDDVPMGFVTENMFQRKCAKKSNNPFFYPKNPLNFFEKNKEFKAFYPRPCCLNLTYYNKAWNTRHIGGHPKILADCTNDDAFFNNTSGPVYPNKCMKQLETTVDPYVSAYHKRIDRVSCGGDLCCNVSYEKSTI